jgi:hypothetical protein
VRTISGVLAAAAASLALGTAPSAHADDAAYLA